MSATRLPVIARAEDLRSSMYPQNTEKNVYILGNYSCAHEHVVIREVLFVDVKCIPFTLPSLYKCDLFGRIASSFSLDKSTCGAKSE